MLDVLVIARGEKITTLTPLAEALDLMKRFRISGVPVTKANGKLVGILTNRDVRFATDEKTPVSALMTKDRLVTVREGVSQEEAKRLLEQAYANRPDAEIAAHLGEVLWVSGQRDAANKVWRQGLEQQKDNETLLETIKRLNPSL